MGRFILFLFVCCSQLLNAQTGSLQVECLQQSDQEAIADLVIEIHSDSFCLEGITNQDGKFMFKGIPAGEVSLWFLTNNQLRTSNVYIQENQLLQCSFLLDSIFKVKVVDFGRDFVSDPDGIQKENILIDGSSIRMADGDLPASQIKEIECVTITAYRVPLINHYGSASGAVVTREDINHLPVRSINGVASTVGGVNSIEGTDGLHLRGGRSDANAYYIDGMRVSSIQHIPKAFISDVTVINGGIPANYGDLTGGVIAVQSRSSIQQSSNYSSKKQRNNTTIGQSYSEPEPTLPQMNYDQFLPIYENEFLSSVSHPNSTFGIDVDRASWTYIKRMIEGNQYVQKDAVKLEEMINSYHYVDVEQKNLINLAMRRIVCPWNSENELVAIHLKAKDLPKDLPRKKHNLVFLIDVSGSMTSSDKLPLLVQGLKDLVKSLNEDDFVSIVTYAGASGVVLEPTSCAQKDKIIEVLNRLTSEGSTNGIGGIQTAYDLAEQHFDAEKNNRIILCTDGDFNVGINTPGDLEHYISSKRGKGIYLTALGFGMGNYHNSTLETIANKGDGNHFYINNLAECKKVLIDDLGNILNIARDVKLNVEFNPDEVKEYRLIGYENRLLKPRDFIDDTKDAGEIGYGHEVTAVYEIVLGKAETDKNHFTKSKEKTGNNSELAFVKLRYKPFEDSVSIEEQFSLPKAQKPEVDSFLTTLIAFGLELRNSAFKGTIDTNYLTEIISNLNESKTDENELKQLIDKYTRQVTLH